MKTKPKYFIVRKDTNNHLWYKYIEWLNKTYRTGWSGGGWLYYGYDGNSEKLNGVDCWDTVNKFQNNPTLLTLEEWKELFIDEFTLPEKWCVKGDRVEIREWFTNSIKPTHNDYLTHPDYKHYYFHYPFFEQLGSKYDTSHNIKKGYTEITFEQFQKYVLKQDKTMITVTKVNLKRIYDVACGGWKPKIEQMAATKPFDDSVELTQAQVDEMFSAATTDQKPLLEEIFGKQEQLFDASMLKIGEMIENKEYGVILKTYNGLVSLRCPKYTWTEWYNLKGRKIPSGTKIEIIAK